MRSIQVDLFLRGIDASGPDRYYVGITKDVDDNHKRHKSEKFDGRNFQYIIVCKCNTAANAENVEWKMKLKGYNRDTDRKGNGGDNESVYVYMFKMP